MNRRHFLRQSPLLSVPFTTWGTLQALSRVASAQASGSPPYRALVCLLLGGGNDSYNMLVPRPNADPSNHWGGANGSGGGEAEWNAYCNIRETVNLGSLSWAGNPAMSQRVLPLINPQGNLLPQALNGNLPFLHALFNGTTHQGLSSTGRPATFIANVGPKVQALTTAQIRQKEGLIPLHIGSHSDQINQWQTCFPQGPSATGWMGRMADELSSSGGGSSVLSRFSLISLDGISTGLVGSLHQPFVDSGGSVFGARMGAVTQSGGAHQAYSQRRDKLQTLLSAHSSSNHVLTRAYAQMMHDSLDAAQTYDGIAASGSRAGVLSDAVLDGSHGMVGRIRRLAKIIEGFATSTHADAPRRQIFFLTFGGWDHHNGLATNHPAHLKVLDSMLAEFYAQMQDLELEDAVTLFTASDFGRALRPNGDGTDHAWGGNHIVLGGAVNGGHIYGQYPKMKLMDPASPQTIAAANADPENLDTVGNGTLAPTLAVDQYMQRLGQWFLEETSADSWNPAANESPWNDVLPNWAAFRDLPAEDTLLGGFMHL